MHLKPSLMTTGLLMGVTSYHALALTTAYIANGVNFVRMQGGGFDVSFTQDGICSKP